MPKIKRTYAAPGALQPFDQGRDVDGAAQPMAGSREVATTPPVAAPTYAAPSPEPASHSLAGSVVARGTVAAPIYAAPQAIASGKVKEPSRPADAAPHRRIDDYDVDKLVFWVCVLLFAIAFAWVR
jgi:hypothetical protein